jgi:signal transduction histidine kinase
MSAGLPRIRRSSSIRTRFLVVVLLGAVLPLALIGVWLTRSVVRAGKDLLHSELDQSLDQMVGAVEQRWSYRHGDLALLAANDVAQRLLTASSTQPIAASDSAYLDQLFTSVAATIPSFEYRDTAGAVRWSTPARPPDTSAARAQRGAAGTSGPTMTVTLPVLTSPGATPLGTMIARLSVAALIPTDTLLRLPNGAKLQVVQYRDRVALLPAFAPDSLLGRDRFNVGPIGWLAVHRSLADPAVDLFLAAPYSAYVQPFERAAQTGVVTLAIASVLVLLVTAFLVTRLTGSLGRLAAAADAVAGGDLEHRVDGRGSDEVRRVAAAFNSMTENLRRTLGQLSQRQALAAVGEYAASLAHEIRNGLTAIRVDLQRAEEKAGPDAPTRTLVGRALENVKRLDGTVSGSLRTARSGHAPRRRVDLRPLLRSATQSAEATFHEHGATVDHVPTGGAPAWVLGDAIALEQLFLNLLLNAAQALGPGERAGVTVDTKDSELRIVVADSGCGIAPEDLDRVLDPFYSTKADGTGLGLSIARQIAVVHGGSLRIESTPGDGTRVEVRLPLATAPAPAPSPAAFR